MKITARYSLLIALIVFAATATAQQPGMADLKAVFNRFKSYATYSFDAEMHAVFPNGKKEEMHTAVYMDKPGKRLCYTTSEQVLILTRQWAYQADHKAKCVSIFDVEKYDQKYKKYLPGLEEVFASDITSLYIDSVLLKSAKLKSSLRKAGKSTYNLSFPEGMVIKEMTIVVNDASGLPESITLRSFHPRSDGSWNKSAGGTTYEVTCRNYTNTVPDKVFDTARYFLIKGGKASLVQYKNYKLLATL